MVEISGCLWLIVGTKSLLNLAIRQPGESRSKALKVSLTGKTRQYRQSLPITPC